MEGIFGQPRAIDQLQGALRAERLHHALIFHGPEGVGKFTTAVALARVLLCQNVETDLAGGRTACAACQACSMIDDTGGTHPDLHIIRKELAASSDFAHLRNRKQMNIPIDLLRERVIGGVIGGGESAKYIDPTIGKTPMLGRGSLFIIDEAELLDALGQNALLKTLEEPPPGTYVILISSSEDRLLPTVRSRCERVAFSPLDDDTVGRWLDEQALELTSEQRQWLITFADGSLGRAMLGGEYNLWTWAQAVDPPIDAMATGVYPTDLGARLAELIDTFAKQWVDAHDNASKDAANRRAAKLMWSLIARRARQQLADVAAEAAAHEPAAAEQALCPWLGVIDALGQAERELASNVNMGLVTDHLVSLMYRAIARPAEAGV